MRRSRLALFTIILCIFSCSCANVNPFTPRIQVIVANGFSSIRVGASPVTLTVTVMFDPGNRGVKWSLSQANAACSPACGTLVPSGGRNLSAVYTPPATVPINQTATITATSLDDVQQTFAFNFAILPPPIAVSITNKFTTIVATTAPVTLNATVSNDVANSGVTWTLTASGATCSPGCGTLTASAAPSFSASYTPPTIIPTGANASPTITATSVTDTTASDSFNFSILSPNPIVVSITNKFATIITGSSPVTVNASVSNDTAAAGVTWTLTAGGANCAPDCGILTVNTMPSFSATYTPPAAVPTTTGDTSPTITATSVSDSTKSDSFSFSITSANSLVKGSYAFLLRGYDLTGSPMALAGSVVADGNGNITGGELDINNGGGITHVPSPAIGNYTIDQSFQGIARVTFTITNFSFPSGPANISFKSVLSSDATRGRIVELDGIGFVNSGTIQLQDSAALFAANPAGTYVFGMDSDAPVGGRTVSAGQLILGANGVTGGLIDESKAGDATPRYSDVALSASAASNPDSSGRGTLTLAVTGTASVTASSRQYAYYVVNSKQLNLIEIAADAAFGTVQAGVAQSQMPMTASSVNTISVLQMTGMDAIPGTQNGIGPDVIIGVMTITGGSVFTDLHFDSNDLGNVLTDHDSGAGLVAFDPNTGRGVISISGGFNSGFVDAAVFYLFDTGKGFIIDADPSTPDGTPPALATTNNAFSGTFTPQQQTPFNQQSISGNALFVSGASAIPDIPAVEAGFNFNATTLKYTAAGDLTSLNTQLGNFPNATFTGGYNTLNVAADGRGTMLLPQQFFGDFTRSLSYPASFYLIGPNQFVLIGVQSGIDSGVSFFDPQ